MLPPIDSIFSRTTSMPTPRPETEVTLAAVEKPGANMYRHRTSLDMRASSASVARPSASALARMRSTSRPRPSSVISMVMLPASCDAETRIEPVSGLPAARRCSGVSMPWSAQLRIMCVSGSRMSSISWRSSSVSEPSDVSSIFFSRSAESSRTRRGRFAKRRPMGCMRARMTLSCKSLVRDESR